MSDFEWLRQTRDLNRPATPQRDLWPRIAMAIETQPVQQRRKRTRWPLALAATLALALMVGFSTWIQRGPSSPTTAASKSSSWQPQDPRLVAGVADVDAARAELTQALATTPDAAYLQRLLARTADTRQRLQDLEQHDLEQQDLEHQALEKSAG